MAGNLSEADETREGPSSEELLGSMYAKQRKRRIFIVVGAIGLLLVGAVGFGFWQVQKAKVAANEAFSAVSQCLIGGAPAEGEAPAARFRRFQLAAAGLPESRRGVVDKVAWPQRCGYRAQELFDAARAAGLTSGGDKNLPYWADALAKILKSPQGHVLDATEPMNAMFELAQKEGLKAGGTKEPGPPNAAAPLNADDLLKVGRLTDKPFSFAKVSLDPIASETRHILVQDPDVPESPMLCSHGAGALSCKRLPDAIAKSKHGLMLIGTTETGAAPLVFAGQRGQSGVFRSDSGEEVYAGFTSAAYVRADGTVHAIVEDDGGKAQWLTAKKGEKPRREDLEIEGYDVGAPLVTTQILWDQLLFVGIKKTEDEKKKSEEEDPEAEAKPIAVHAYARTIDPSGKLGAPTDLGAVGEVFGGMPRGGRDQVVWGCRSSGTMTALVHVRGQSHAIAYLDGKWTAPLDVFVSGGALCDPGGFGTAGFAHGSESEPWNGSISHTRCTTAGCQSRSASMKDILTGGLELAPRARLGDAVPLGDDVVVAWVAGDRGGVRARVGAADKLPQLDDIVVFDDLIKDSKLREKSIVTDIGLLPGQGGATVVIATEVGVFAILIKKDGSLEPLPVSKSP